MKSLVVGICDDLILDMEGTFGELAPKRDEPLASSIIGLTIGKPPPAHFSAVVDVAVLDNCAEHEIAFTSV